MNTTELLFPYRYKKIGLFLIVPGIVLAIIRFYFGIKPEIFDIKVFAFYSKYLQTITFSPITNHVTEEIAGILILIGLVTIVLSKDKFETDLTSEIRYQSLMISIIINSVIILFSFIFVFGLGFVYVLIFNIYSLLIIHIIVFQISKYFAARNKIKVKG